MPVAKTKKIKVILMRNIAKKGFHANFGDCIEVKSGYAKNFLIPNGIALFANKSNLEKFEKLKREEMEKANEIRKEAEILRDKINAVDIAIEINTSQDGKIFGSVGSKDVIESLRSIYPDLSISKNQIFINSPIKMVGDHIIQFNLSTDVSFEKKISVRSLSGENPLMSGDDEDSDVLGYDYKAQIRSGDKRFDYLDNSDGE